MKSLICSIFPQTEKVGQLMPEAIARMGTLFFLSRNARKDYLLHSDPVNREKIGSGSLRGNKSEKENRRNVQLLLSEIMCDLTSWASVQPPDYPAYGYQVPFLPLISVVKFYCAEVLGVFTSPHLSCCCCTVLSLFFLLHS